MANAMSAVTPDAGAQQELALLESAELKLALTPTADLAGPLAAFLPAILLKLDSSAPVRQKALEVLGSLAKRARSEASLKVPVEGILDLWGDLAKAPKTGPPSDLLRTMGMVFVDIGVGRLDKDAQSRLVPLLVRGIGEGRGAWKMAAFGVFLSLLPTYAPPTSLTPPASAAPAFAEPDALFVCQRLAHLLLYHPPPPPKPKANQTQAELLASRGAPEPAPDPLTPQPGLSQPELLFLLGTPSGAEGSRTYKNLTPGGPLHAAQLGTTKAAAVRLLASSLAFPDQKLLTKERYWCFLVASVDGISEVASRGEDGMKKIGRADLEAADAVAYYYGLYFLGSQQDKASAAERATPLPPQLKAKLLQLLSRSVLAANTFPQLLQASFDALFASTDAKLRLEGMRFAVWCLRAAKLKPAGGWLDDRVGGVLLGGFTKVAEEPQDDATGSKDAATRAALVSLAYDAAGLLCSRIPALFSTTPAGLALPPRLLARLSAPETPAAERQSVLDLLSVLAPAYSCLPAAQLAALRGPILAAAASEAHQARFAAAKYAARLYPPEDAWARVRCLLGKRGLPTLRGFLVELNDAKSGPGARGKTVGGWTVELYAAAADWGRCLVLHLGAPGKATAEYPSLEADDPAPDAEVGKAAGKWLAGALEGEEAEGVRGYISLLEGPMLSRTADEPLQATCAAVLLEMTALGGKGIRDEVEKAAGSAADWLMPFLQSTRIQLRTSAAHLLGLLASGLPPEPLSGLLRGLVDTARTPAEDKTVTPEHRHGALLAASYLYSRTAYRGAAANVPAELVAQLSGAAVAGLDASGTGAGMLQGGSVAAVAELGRYVPLPVGGGDAMEVDGEEGKREEPAAEVAKDADGAASAAPNGDSATPTAAKENGTPPKPKTPREEVVHKLAEVVRKAKEPRLQETAVAALADLTLGDPSLSSRVLDFFYSLATLFPKQVESQFAVGEGIAAVAGGWSSSTAARHLDLPDVAFPPPDRTARDPALLDGIFASLEGIMSKGGAAARRAVCVWLLAVVRHCSGMPEFGKRMPRLYSAFRSLLTDRDEFTQEVASKGIGLVYELADKDTRSELVRGLMGTLVDTKKRVAGEGGTLTGDTQLFETSLGSAPGDSGGAISTYQSVLSLAADLNNPELVYRFMNLASHNAIWSSRRGASMGIASIMAAAEEELSQYLPTLVPKLFRYRFDANPKVAEAMQNIWRALVKEPQKAVDAHFDAIARDLLAGMGDRLWRTREASCSAMAELMNGRSIEQLQPYLDEVWTMCFRCLDDIKETVRTAALSTCKTLTSVTVKFADPTVSSPKDGQKIMDIVLPFMLHKGLTNMAKDVRSFALQTIMKLCKKGAVLLRPHVADLVTVLLESLSDLEPQMMNYLALNADKYGVTQDQLDSSRLSATKGSPVMQALEGAVDHVDGTNIGAILPKLAQIARKGVGLPTKAGCARFIVTLVVRHPSLIQPADADSLLRAVLAGMVSDRNPTLRKAYAVSIGYLGSACSPAALGKLVEDLRGMYAGPAAGEDPDAGLVPAFAMRELSRHSSDAFKSRCLDVALPLAYYGMHDPNEEVAGAWKDVWEDNTAGASSALRMYLAETVGLLGGLVGGSASWGVKRQAGETVRDLAKALAGSSGNPLGQHVDGLVKVMTDAIAGRTWDGKEAVLEGLVGVVVAGKESFAGPGGDAKLDAIFKVLVREAKKNNRPYRRLAIEQWGNFLEAFPGRDWYAAVREVSFDAAKDAGDDEDDDEDVQMKDARGEPISGKRVSPLSLLIRAASYKALVKAFPAMVAPPDKAKGTANGAAFVPAGTAKATQEEHAKELAGLLADSLDELQPWNLRQAVLQSLEIFLPKLDLATCNDGMRVMDPASALRLARGLLRALADYKYSAVRENALRCLGQLFGAIKGTPAMDAAWKKAVVSELEVLAPREGLQSIKAKEVELRKEIEAAMVD
ncbi:proteasome stabiliser-domain-containing protein [Hyaloraphidium curvatum]|nr:proteasome stabiliser-domain-containing protein [Hyaloraphidium curvatum]